MGKGTFTERPAGLAPASPTGWWTSFLGPQTRGSDLRAEACIMIILHRSASRNPPTRPTSTHRRRCRSHRPIRLDTLLCRAQLKGARTGTIPAGAGSGRILRTVAVDQGAHPRTSGEQNVTPNTNANTAGPTPGCGEQEHDPDTRGQPRGRGHASMPPASAWTRAAGAELVWRSLRLCDPLDRAVRPMSFPRGPGGRAPVGRADQRSPAKRSFSGTAAPVASLTRTKVSMPINSPNLSLPILRKKMFSP